MRISHSELLQHVHYDPLTGVFTRLLEPSKGPSRVGVIKGTRKPSGHLKVSLLNREYPLAQLAYFYMTGTWGNIIDHINNIPTDNRWCNLRSVSIRENVQNQTRAHHHNQSGLIGAHWRSDKKKFESTITANGKRKRLGYFKTAQEAHEAYKRAKRIYHSTCTI